MNKNALSRSRIFLAAIVFAGTAIFSGCKSQDGWDEAPERQRSARSPKTQAQKATHLKHILANVVLIRMNEKAEICIGENEKDVMQPKDFSKKIREIGKEFPQKPVLFFVEDEARNAQPEIFSYVIRECRRAGLGKIYFDVPDAL